VDFEALRQAIQQEYTLLTRHARDELIADVLEEEQVWTSILDTTAEIIEDYPADPRGPSCLILSFVQEQPVHTVVAYPSRRFATQRQLPALVVLITAYRPDRRPAEWSADYRTRLLS
jgi:hypothetical protein